MRLRFEICFALVAFGGALAAGCQNTGVTSFSNAVQPAATHPDKTKKAYYWPPEVWNGWVTRPSPGPSPVDFEIVFKGNVTADIPTPVPGYGVYDPFCATTCANSVKVAYNATSNTTTAEWSGSTLYQNIPGYPNEVHFGILNGPGGADVKCHKYYTEWTFTSASPQVTPVLNLCGHKRVQSQAAASAPTVFATVYVETSFSPITAGNPATSGGWYDVPYTQLNGSAQPKFKFINSTSQTIYTGNSGIVLNQAEPSDSECLKTLYCDENIKNLELLNYSGMPPPGSSGSPFVPMQYPPPSKLPAGH